MRYRVKEYRFGSNKLRREVYCHITVPDKVYSALEQAEEDGDLLRTVTEAVRLIADETQGGYVLMSTGQKSTLSGVQLRSDNDVMLTFSVGALITAADGDEDDIAAINAMQNTDQFTIEMDWGDEPGASPSADQLAQFFGLPEALPSGYEFMTDTEVTDELEDIMQALDPELLQEVEYPEGSGTYMTKAQAITAEAMQIINPSQS